MFHLLETSGKALSDPLFVVHTSGSTGIPKPLLYTHATAVTNIKMMSLNPSSGYESQDRMYQGKRVFKTFPPYRFHPELGPELRHITDGIHGLYAVRDPELKELQPTFTIFSDIQEYASRDLFVRHASKDKQHFWSWQARADDIVVLLNGEKTNPNSMKQHIVSRNPDVSAALIVGA
ncbi:MAG: hypothetical protein Q9161_009490 [Pseudevernia consocians]